MSTMLDYIEQESEALTVILQEYQEKLASLKVYLEDRAVNKIMILATGSSYNAALCARYYFEERFGILIDIKEPYNFTHYERVDPATDLVIAVSQSGKSSSTLEAMKKVQALGIAVFCLTSSPASPAAKQADGVLDINTGLESVGFVTRGFSATVLNLLLIALMVAESRGLVTQAERAETLAELKEAALAIPGVIDKTNVFIARHRRHFIQASRFVAIGYGALTGVAKECETKFTETVRLPSGGFELEAYMHGPYLEANARHTLFFIEDRPHARSAALRDYMRPAVDAVFTVTLAAGNNDENTLALNFPLTHNFAPLLLIVPFQLLAFNISAAKGTDLSVRIFDDFDKVLKSKI
ncbi:SIS domain-containing protein [Dryocola sp. BD613]|uniref:SIS domain-containing protein n=1 Tax=Dryocola sp. BD613 TaxID=3133272 RepID=UPI003F5059D5